jgi:hypothetical protein
MRVVGFTRLTRIVPPFFPQGVLAPRGELFSPWGENGGTTQDAFRRIAFPASLWPIIVAVTATSTQHLAASDRIESLTRTFDGAETRFAHRFARAHVSMRLCEASGP